MRVQARRCGSGEISVAGKGSNDMVGIADEADRVLGGLPQQGKDIEGKGNLSSTTTK